MSVENRDSYNLLLQVRRIHRQDVFPRDLAMAAGRDKPPELPRGVTVVASRRLCSRLAIRLS